MMDEEMLQHMPFDGADDYVAALDRVCSMARNSLLIFEKDFADIGFNREARYDTLHRFLLGGGTGRLRLLAHDPQHLVRYCPRMMRLLREFSHSMSVFQTLQKFILRDEAQGARSADDEKTKFRCRLMLAKPALSEAAKTTYHEDRRGGDNEVAV